MPILSISIETDFHIGFWRICVKKCFIAHILFSQNSDGASKFYRENCVYSFHFEVIKSFAYLGCLLAMLN